MKLIIDIPEEIYKASQIIDVKYEDVVQIPLEVIANGTPLVDVLDKLRAEIQEYKSRTVFGIGVKVLETGKQVALDNVLGIIDKYRTESEE